jgi:hypothetical protein
MVATTAAACGVLLGGFVMVEVFAPAKPRPDSSGTAQAAAESKAVPKPAAETTGSAPADESVASSDCDRQTWPNLSRICMEELRKNRATRVVSTDKLDKATVSAIEAQPQANDETKLAAPALWDPSMTSPEPIAAPAAPIVTASAPTEAAETAPSPPAVASPAPAAEPPAQAAAAAEAKLKHAKKSKHSKPRAKPRLDGEDRAVATNDADDRATDERPDRSRRDERRPDRSRRVVDRWTERDYDVPNEDGRGRRQVTVIHRGGGGFFENLFGMGGGGRDDDD